MCVNLGQKAKADRLSLPLTLCVYKDEALLSGTGFQLHHLEVQSRWLLINCVVDKTMLESKKGGIRQSSQVRRQRGAARAGEAARHSHQK